jgi:queuine tRNA-ribosyltransferase
MAFTLRAVDSASAARAGSLALNHGTVETPCFMPVGTNATVKAMSVADLEELGLRLILGNTYHLLLRPGPDVIEAAGGLHRFMGWPHNVLTDSGGYQVMSLAKLRRIEEGGVSFRSHLDGSERRLSPEDVIDLEVLSYGSDVAMPLDVCTPPGIPRSEAEEALALTTRWLARSRDRWRSLEVPLKGELFGIMQGNFHRDLREASAGQMVALDLPGYAIGGLSVGEEFAAFREFTHLSAYVLEAIEAGIDLFDCVFPTRTARNALVFTPDGPLNLRLEANRKDLGPIDPSCRCTACRAHSRAYLRHLFKAREILAAMLATRHNLAFLASMVSGAREAILAGHFTAFKRGFLARYGQQTLGSQSGAEAAEI